MKRTVCLLVVLQCFVLAWSQTMTVYYKNGNTQSFNMADIESIDFPQGEDDQYGSEDFIELTIDGKTYHKNLFGIYARVGKTDDLVLTGIAEDVFKDDGFQFLIGLTHPDSMDKLLSLSPGRYDVKENSMETWLYDDVGYLCLFPEYQKNKRDYDLQSGSHQVKSIKKVNNGVQVSGAFDITVARNGDSVRIEGKYAVTVK